MDFEAPVAESLVEFSYWHAIFIIGAVVTYFVDLVFGKSIQLKIYMSKYSL